MTVWAAVAALGLGLAVAIPLVIVGHILGRRHAPRGMQQVRYELLGFDNEPTRDVRPTYVAPRPTRAIAPAQTARIPLVLAPPPHIGFRPDREDD